MKVIFHPSYDNGYYEKTTGDSQSVIGTKVVGTMGLLEHLSLRNALSGRYLSDGERASAYLSHVSQKAPGTMIETSFKNDPLGVAKCLLRWRDLLIMAGWNPMQSGDASTPKLQLLNNIETSWKAELKGTADRWLELANLSKEQPLVEDGDTLECRCPKECLPRLVLDVLQSCKASFVSYPEAIQIADKDNINILHYNNLADAYRQLAAHSEDYKDCVIINRDNVSLNHILFSWGKPLVKATIQDSNPLTLQLFKLALSVFSRPLNIQNVVSYLQLPVGPVPRKLRHSLANVLIADGGFGAIDWNGLDKDEEKNRQKSDAIKEAGIRNNWELAIYDYINEEDASADLTKIQREAKTTLLKYITDSSIKEGEEIPVQTIKEYVGEFNKWASAIVCKENDGDEMLKSQLATVVSYFKQLSDALKGITAMSYPDLEKHVRTIYQPVTITQAHSQLGSLNVVSSYNQLLDTPDKLLWLDCCDADVCHDQYEFLSTAERMWLSNQENITIPTPQKILEQNRKEMLYTLANINGEITLVTADYYHNKKMAEHPLIAELKMLKGEALTIQEGKRSLPMAEAENIKKMEPKVQYNIENVTYGGRSESNTSIDSFINYPFDYVMHYVAALKESSSKELSSLQTIMGNVAHCFIEGLVDSVVGYPKNQRLTEMRSLLQNEYDKRLDEAIATKGLALLLKENKVEYNNLKFQLKHSIEVLISIMEHQNLVPVGCELKYDKPLGVIINDFNARIDMELEDANGDAVIFDFKWSYSKYYGEKIEAGKSIQLELYRKELEMQDKNVAAVGYYLLPKCALETADYDTLKDAKGNVIISHIEAPTGVDLFGQIENSVAQRKVEIEQGHIEEGEGMDISGQPYSQEIQKGTDLLKVGVDKKGCIKKESNKVFTNKPTSRFKKEFPKFTNDNAPLNETPTTYPLMKGRLK